MPPDLYKNIKSEIARRILSKNREKWQTIAMAYTEIDTLRDQASNRDDEEELKKLDGSRRKRIANGSGTDVATINKLLKQFKMMSDMMKKMSKGNLKGMADKGIPPELFNQLK